MNTEFVYGDLSYKINGICFDVFHALGSGLKEATYEKAIAVGFKKANISYKRQSYAPIIYKGESVGSHYFDFIVEDKIIVELKVGEYFDKRNIDQVHEYLKYSNLKLGLLINFTRSGVRTKRIVNLI